MNIFEGSRRAVIVTGIVWLAGVSYYGWQALGKQAPPQMVYKYPILGGEPVPYHGSARCLWSGVRAQTTLYTTKTGRPVQLTLCFSESDLEKRLGKPRVPAPDPNDIYAAFGGFGRLPENSQAFMNEATDTFVMPGRDEDFIEKTQSEAQKSIFVRYLGYLVKGLFALWLGATAIGWITRGFLGIPRGQDAR